MALQQLPENLPVGYRFVPNDRECIYYLKAYNWEEPTFPTLIHQVDLLNHNPQDLFGLYGTEMGNGCLLITPRRRMYRGSRRPSRQAPNGFYKSITNDVSITDGNGVPTGGVVKTLVYYEGRRPGRRTNWFIKEYRLVAPEDNEGWQNVVTHMVDGLALYKLYDGSVDED